jgi:hypothetical protein
MTDGIRDCYFDCQIEVNHRYARGDARRKRSSRRETQQVETSMRTFVAAIAIFGMFATAVQAADDASPVFGSFPPNTRAQQVYLFMLKKNGLSIRISPDQFCSDLGYGEAVKSSDSSQKGFWDADESGTDGKKPGTLNWVICQFPKPH